MSRVLNLSSQIARDDTHAATLGAHANTANGKHFEQIHVSYNLSSLMTWQSFANVRDKNVKLV